MWNGVGFFPVWIWSQSRVVCLTVRMHHNSQKRITPASPSGTLMTSLCHSRAENIVQHRLRCFLCAYATTQSAKGDPTRGSSLGFFRFCSLLLFIKKKQINKKLPSPAALTVPHPPPPCVTSAAPHERLSDYIYSAVSSMEMRLIGWDAVERVKRREGSTETNTVFTNCRPFLQLRWVFLTPAFLREAKARQVKQKENKCISGRGKHPNNIWTLWMHITDTSVLIPCSAFL